MHRTARAAGAGRLARYEAGGASVEGRRTKAFAPIKGAIATFPTTTYADRDAPSTALLRAHRWSV